VLLSKGAKVYIAARSEEKSQQAIEELKRETGKKSIFFLKLDLADLFSVKVAAERFLRKESQLHTLYNNTWVLTTCATLIEACTCLTHVRGGPPAACMQK
jgi:retinol dehydrogenase 12